ncbi:MAG: signal recognition particle protein, partial [Candidatus Brocadiia bacterium]|nr:signal recognition particle protein [Candidatus Brocadiia bacterium]
RQATFDLEDFLGQLQQLKKMGSLTQLVEMLPGMSSLKSRMPEGELSEDQFKKVEALIYSMTPQERHRPELIGGSRRRRIARGSGMTPQDVNMLLNQFRQTRKLMRQVASGKGLGDLSRLIR